MPDIDSVDGLIDLMCGCILIILGNVLDFRTYRAPHQDDDAEFTEIDRTLLEHDFNSIPYYDRLAICHARGVALHILHWIRCSALIKDVAGNLIQDLPSLFFIQITRTLVAYKTQSLEAKLDVDSCVTLPLLTNQIKNVLKIDPVFVQVDRSIQEIPDNNLSFAHWNVGSIQWRHDTRFNVVEKNPHRCEYIFLHDHICVLIKFFIRFC